MARFYEKIISCKNEGIYRVITLFGIKFKRKNARVQTLAEIKKLSAQCANLAGSVRALSEFSKQSHETINALLTKRLGELDSQLEILNKISGQNHHATARKLEEASNLLKSHAANLAELRAAQEEANKLQGQNHQATAQKLEEANNLLKTHAEKLAEFRVMQEEVNVLQGQNHHEAAQKLDEANSFLKFHTEMLSDLGAMQMDSSKLQGRNHTEAARKLDEASKLLKSHVEKLAEFRVMQEEVNTLQERKYQETSQQLNATNDLLKSHTAMMAEFRTMQAEVSRLQEQNHQETSLKLDEVNKLLKSHAGLKRRLSNLKYIIEAQTLHMKTFAPYKNAFKDEDVVLVCTGPTARYYAPIKNAIHVGVNGAIYLEWLKLDYLFIQDYTIHQEGNENLVEDALSYRGNNCKKFFGVMPSERLAELQKHIGRIPLRYTDGANICQYLLEDVRFHEIAYDLAREPLGEFGGTVFSALQFILYTNPKTLYIAGWDCGAGYAYNKSQLFGSANYQLEILKKYFLPFIENQHSDMEIITLNPVGLKGIFIDLYTEKYLQDHPEIEECVSPPFNS